MRIHFKNLKEYKDHQGVLVLDSSSLLPMVKDSAHLILDTQDLAQLFSSPKKDIVFLNKRKDCVILAVLLGIAMVWKTKLFVYTDNDLFWTSLISTNGFNWSV